MARTQPPSNSLPSVSPASPSVGDASRRASFEPRLVTTLIVFTLLASCLPYALGYFLAPVMGRGGTTFIGTPYNIDDYCNYLSWLRQMADGHFFIHNLFTTDPQKDIEFNVFFWLLGRVMAVTHCSPQAVLQFARIAGGLGLLVLLYRFYRYCLPEDAPARLTAFGFACLSSGFGWLAWPRWLDKNYSGGPVDSWQPEAYTFLSLYTSALMTVSTLLILGALYALLLGERTGRWKYAVIAGLCGAVLGNMHSYDVLHLAAAWGTFLLVLTVLRRGQGMAPRWGRGLLALALSAPTTLYIAYMYRVEAVFQKRANVPTLSPRVLLTWHGQPVLFQGHSVLLPAPWHYALGYGVVFLLACVALWLVVRQVRFIPNPAPAPSLKERAGGEVSPLLFAACWAVGGLLIAYFPIAFQRKMLMGEHLPLCLLAGVGAAWLVRTYLPARTAGWALAGLVLLSAPSNALFLTRDMRHLTQNLSETHLAPFLDKSLVDVYAWVRTNTPADAKVVGPPGLCTYLPGETGRAVWAGHWAETPDYGAKDAAFADAFDQQTPPAVREAFLKSTGAQYLFYPNDLSQASFKRRDGLHHWVELSAAPAPYLNPVYKNDLFTIYEIQ